MNRLVKFLPALLLALVAGCIVTGNILFIIELDPVSLDTSKTFDMWEVTEEDNDDWKDHKDQIKHVVDAGFTLRIENLNQNDKATGDIYISKENALDEGWDVNDIIANATKILSGITVAPGGTRVITWSQSYDFLSNFDVLVKYIMDGEMYVYAVGIGDNLDIEVTKIALIITINAEP